MTSTDSLCFWALLQLLQTGVLGQSWSVTYPPNVCAVRGSTVVFPCKYTYPQSASVTVGMWCYNHFDCVGTTYVCHSNNTDLNPSFTGRAHCLWDKESNCTLQINNTKLSDTGKYRFRFLTQNNAWTGRTGVDLSVTALVVLQNSSTVNVSVTEGDSVNLTCTAVGCPLSQSQFSWFKDNKRVPQETAATLQLSRVSCGDSGHYWCALSGQQDTVSEKFLLYVECKPAASETVPLVLVLGILLVVLLLSVVLIVVFVKRKRAESHTGESAEPPAVQAVTDNEYGNISVCKEPPEEPEGEEVSYAAVQFKTKPKASDVQEIQEEPVVYSAVCRKTAHQE